MSSPNVLVFFLLLSLSVNLFLMWYCFRLIKELLDISSSLKNLFMDIKTFSNHLGSVYELETFYGDQTLNNLLSHAKALTGEFTRYESLFDITGEGQDVGQTDQETPQTQE